MRLSFRIIHLRRRPWSVRSGRSLRPGFALARVVVPAILLVGPGACGAEDGHGNASAVMTRDSAGVAIIEYGEEAWRNAPVWRLDSVPLVAIGTVDGPPEYELEYVTDAVRLDDGTIAIADLRASGIKFYDRQGKFVRSVGRDGKGPAEYQLITFFSRYRTDSLLVWDGDLGRGTLLAKDGSFGRIISQPGITYGVDLHGVFRDGWILGAVGGFRSSDVPLGVSRRSVEYFRFSLAGQVDTIARLFAGEFQNTGRLFGEVPFSPTPVAMAAGDIMYYTPAEAYELQAYTEAGRLLRIIRFARQSPLTHEDLDRALEERRAGFPAEYRALEAGVAGPEMIPLYDKMNVDADGNVWIGDYVLHTAEQPRGWTILGPDGALRGRLQTPPGFTIYDIGNDWLLGGMPGEMDVPRVLLYRLIKSS